MIRLSDVTVKRGPNVVVETLRIDVKPGRIFWLVGPNGAGKTSLLRVLAELDPPRAGAVIRDCSPLLYFQSEMALPTASTVGSWERLVQRLRRTDEVVGRTRLWPDVEPARRIGRMSTGQRKRLLLDALLRQPGPMALDEPFEHLSPDAKMDLRDLLEERARHHEVVVATNQQTSHAQEDGGLRLEAGAAQPLTPPEAPAGGWQ